MAEKQRNLYTIIIRYLDNAILTVILAGILFQQLLFWILGELTPQFEVWEVSFEQRYFGFEKLVVLIAYIAVILRNGYAFLRRQLRFLWLLPDFVFIALVALYYDSDWIPIYIIVLRHAFFVAYLYLAVIRTLSFFKRSRLSPVLNFVLIFGILMLLGSILLTLPISQRSPDQPVGYLDALFTAVSAISDTGLVVVDTGSAYSLLGHIVILLLIELGGLGIMTFTALVSILAGQSVGLRERRLMTEFMGDTYKDNFRKLVKWIITFSLIVEGIMAIVLFWLFRSQMDTLEHLQSVWDVMFYSIFYAISGFCNAGFTLFSDSLNQFMGFPPIIIVMIIGCLMGSTGFLVIYDIMDTIRQKLFPQRYPRVALRTISENTKVILITTFWIFVVGTLFFLLTESSNTLAQFRFNQQVLNTFFKTSVGRIAGFTVSPWNDVEPETSWFMIILMFFGGPPGSVAGGVKITALFLLFVALRAYLTRSSIIVYKRSIPKEVLLRLCSLVALAAILIFLVSVILMISENQPFLKVCFEATSAFSIVGLSLGITSDLSPFGKILISMLMFIGRVGPAVFVLVTEEMRPLTEARFPKADVFVG
jgi:trk system potassium uptake protein